MERNPNMQPKRSDFQVLNDSELQYLVAHADSNEIDEYGLSRVYRLYAGLTHGKDDDLSHTPINFRENDPYDSMLINGEEIA